MRVAIYTRVSTTEQNTDRQTFELREYSKARGWKIVVEESDRMSGAKKRPGAERVMALAKARKIDVLLVHKIDRWGRSTQHLVNSLAELDAVGVKFVSLGDGFDFTTPNGKLLFTIIAGMAEFERSLIRERILSGLARAKREGRTLGRPRVQIAPADLQALVAEKLPVREMARRLKVSRTAVQHAIGGRA